MFDYLIQGAKVADGTGKPAYTADVGIEGGKIAAVGDLRCAEARTILDAKGRWLTPGFLDIHRHGDAALFRPGYGQAELRQGLTSVINGNCGLSLSPITGPYAKAVEDYLAPITGPAPDGRRFSTLADYQQQAAGANAPMYNGMLVGMGTLRACVSGFETGDLTTEQERQLHGLLETALADGALGVSLGLGYAPECFYSTRGLIRALEPLRDGRVPVTVHMRQEGDGVEEALEEMLTVARTLHLKLEVSHLKSIGTRNWRRSTPNMLEKLRRAREEGVDVRCDVYPYTGGSTQLIHVLPPEIQEGGTEAMTEALRRPEVRKHLRERMESGSDFENIVHLVGFENVLATGLKRYPELEGQSIQNIAEQWGKDPYDALFDLLADENCTVSMIDFITAEEDIQDILRQDFSGVISDATYPVEGLCHPRVYGTFPRLLERYVREKKLLTVEQAVHKITGAPAELFGLANKGQIRAGADADLCLFSLENIHETGTWQAPAQFAQGMDWVFVGGQAAIADGVYHPEVRGGLLTR